MKVVLAIYIILLAAISGGLVAQNPSTPVWFPIPAIAIIIAIGWVLSVYFRRGISLYYFIWIAVGYSILFAPFFFWH